MPKQEIICGLDIGSGQVICVLGYYDQSNGMINVVSSGQEICRGAKGGVVVDIDDTANAIGNAVEEAEKKSDVVIHKLYLGVRGTHVETYNSRGVVSISRTDKEITSDDVTSAVENAKAIRISSDREIIDTISQDSSLDGQRGVHNPVGMEGSYLEVYVHIVTASITHLNNIYKGIAKAGFSVIEPIYGLLATGDVVVTEEEKALGCLLIDLGGQSIGLAVYSEGSIKYSKELAIGADLLTADISHALRTSVAQAKLIKEKHGTAMPSLLKDDSEVEFMGVDGRTLRKVTRKYLSEIIAPRLEEIFDKISNELQSSPYADVIVPGGIILTGGGASLEGATIAAEKILGVSTRLGLPQGVTGANNIVADPSYATDLGLLKYRPSIEAVHMDRKRVFVNVIKKVRDWL